MKRFALLALLAAAVLVAYLSTALPGSNSPFATRIRALWPAVSPKAQIAAPAAPSWLARLESAAASLISGKPATQASNAPISLLLREPVVIVRGSQPGAISLPAGTAVSLVSNDGSFLRVQHEHNIVVIPRSSVVYGVSRTN